MDAKLLTIHRQQQAQDARLLALAKAVYRLLEVASDTNERDPDWEPLKYDLNEAFDFELP